MSLCQPQAARRFSTQAELDNNSDMISIPIQQIHELKVTSVEES
jgi:hypothetical protein